jgi:16S rRNA (cytidine1402-2'-O)-methyltransferase
LIWLIADSSIREHPCSGCGMKNDRPTESREIKSGTLYIVSTPIGNLEDTTMRALKILKQVDLIAAENTKQTKKLCSHYDIRTRLTSYNQHNREARAPALINRLKAGSDIALVSSAGTPVISDPGAKLIHAAMDEGIHVSPVPGPSAVTTALSVCGLRTDRFIFLGFLSNRPNRRKKELTDLKDEQKTMVIFEAPHRVEGLLRDLHEIFGDRRVVVLRELTKVYEEIKKGSAASILEGLDEENVRGEYTIVVEGREKGKNREVLPSNVKERIRDLLREEKKGVKEIATGLSTELGLKYRTLYRECLTLKKEMGGRSTREPAGRHLEGGSG